MEQQSVQPSVVWLSTMPAYWHRHPSWGHLAFTAKPPFYNGRIIDTSALPATPPSQGGHLEHRAHDTGELCLCAAPRTATGFRQGLHVAAHMRLRLQPGLAY
jgi:hypothetical protein